VGHTLLCYSKLGTDVSVLHNNRINMISTFIVMMWWFATPDKRRQNGVVLAASSRPGIRGRLFDRHERLILIFLVSFVPVIHLIIHTIFHSVLKIFFLAVHRAGDLCARLDKISSQLWTLLLFLTANKAIKITACIINVYLQTTSKKTVAGMAGVPTKLVTTIISVFRGNNKKQWHWSMVRLFVTKKFWLFDELWDITAFE
jgi:hypothetical protein